MPKLKKQNSGADSLRQFTMLSCVTAKPELHARLTR